MIVAVYTYTDENGNPLYRKLRDDNKNFVWERHAGGEWLSRRDGGECPLYNLPAVIKAIESGTGVWIAEGEKDADRLISAGVVATTNPDGAGPGKWLPRYTRTLAGARIRIIADRDDKGRAYAQNVYAELLGSVKTAEIFEADLDFKGADVSDHLDAGKTLNELRPVDPDTTPGLGPRPEYPVKELCGPMRQFTEWSIRDGLRPEAAGHAALAALATVCADARMVSPIETAPSLWLVAIGPSSSGKSPALKQAFKSIDAEFKRQTERYVNEKMQCKSIGELGGDPPRYPVAPMPWCIGDATPEALVGTMNDANGKIAIVVDELDAFLSAFGAYSTGKRGSDTERAKYREMWSGRPISKVRVGTGRYYIAEPVLTIFGPLVPEDVGLLGGATNGDWARWLPSSVPPGTPEVPKEKEPIPGPWTETVGRLMEWRGVPREWRLDDDGFRLFGDASKRWREQRFNVPEHVAQALMKAGEQACRIALVIAESMDPGKGGEIPAGAMSSAIAIVDYCIKVWESIPGERSVLAVRSEQRAQLNAAERLLAWIQRRKPDDNGVRKATKREIQKAKVAGCKTAAEVDEMIDAYVDQYAGTRQHVDRQGGTTVYIREPVTGG